MKRIRKIAMILVILVFIYLIYGQIFLPKDTAQYNLLVEDYNEGWVQVSENGERKKLRLPGNYEDRLVMENVLPSDIGNQIGCIVFRGEKTKIYVDGKLRCTYDNRDKSLFGTKTTEAYIMVDLYPQDAGKTIRAELESVSGILYPVSVGSDIGIWYSIFKQYGGELAIAMLTLFLGVVCALACQVLKYTFHREVPLEYLSYGICMGALWIIFNSVCRELFFRNIATISDMCYFMIMMIPFPILYYLNSLQKCRYESGYVMVCRLLLVNFFCCTGLHVLGLVDFQRSFFSTALCCFLAIFLLGFTILLDIMKKRVQEYRYVAIGLLCVIAAAVVQILRYFNRTGVFSGSYLAVGLIVLLLFAVINTSREISFLESEKQRAIMESQAKDQFLANMSHEIRTPINAVIGMNEMILRESSEEVIREYARDIQTAGKSLLTFVNDILDYSQKDAVDAIQSHQFVELSGEESMIMAPDAHILVVDDNFVNRKVFVNLLKASKMQIDEASSGEMCLSMVEKNAYDLIFLDHMMPGLDGIETLKQIKQDGDKHTVVIALTANAIKGAREMYLKEGFDNYLTKPIMPGELNRILATYLGADKLVKQEKTESEITGKKDSGQDNLREQEIIDKLKEIPELDLDYARQFNPNITFFLNVVKDFCLMIPVEAEILRSNYELLMQWISHREAGVESPVDRDEALKQYRVKVHSMKTSAAMVGALGLSGVAKLLEAAAGEEDWDTMSRVTAPFLEMWCGYEEKLKVCLEKKEEACEEAVWDKNMLKLQLKQLQAAMEELDLDQTDDLIRIIEGFSYPDEVDRLIKTISLAVTNLDGEQVNACCDSLYILLEKM